MGKLVDKILLICCRHLVCGALPSFQDRGSASVAENSPDFPPDLVRREMSVMRVALEAALHMS